MFSLRLPRWVQAHLPRRRQAGRSLRERMRLVIELSRLNVERGTGGPFAAGVFEIDTGRLIAPGVNLVVPAGCSVAHAEIVAIILAQRVLGRWDLGAPDLELVSSTAPCAMCLGAIAWSGVRRLVCGARGSDAERIGFDEGDKPARWVQSLRRRGVEVVQDVLRLQAVEVLRAYRDAGGVIYNGRPRCR